MIKRIVKRIIGEKKIRKYKERKQFGELLKKELRFEERTETEKVWLRTVVNAHSIEKSMAVYDVESLCNCNRYKNCLNDCIYLLENGYASSSYVVVEITSVIRAVCNFLNARNLVISEVKDIEQELHRIVNKYNITFTVDGGIEKLPKEKLSIGKNFEWNEFAKSRRSVRIFSDKIVSQDIIRKIIIESRYYPSACNRQPCKVYYATSREANDRIINYVNDTRTVRTNIHNFFIVTCDKHKFTPGELYQDYINGGIFLSYLILSIHAQGMGSCIFQYVQHNKRDNEIHSVLCIPENETIIAFVGYGEIQNENNILCASRCDFDDMAVEIK
ncbi:nitroreductase family protein [uncultured Treponema sp.]|uniref:nitroreductase family protein n=1 Tax=uncultured Treponema sp. TaxID=162155 RepID=UPI00280AFF8F|nr:nitroreductase family protein [uncultured Treponema sp.]